MVFMANTPVLARAPAIQKALAETGMRLEQGSNTSMPLAERVRGAWSAVSAEHCSEHTLPKGPQAQGAMQEHAVCPSSPWKRRVSSAYSPKDKSLPPTGSISQSSPLYAWLKKLFPGLNLAPDQSFSAGSLVWAVPLEATWAMPDFEAAHKCSVWLWAGLPVPCTPWLPSHHPSTTSTMSLRPWELRSSALSCNLCILPAD